ncbi:alpha-mannosidase [Poriferisphaera sp. WC338]|uniref:alpha-mannosidase n=1 Tax=Poriferisphaera sp. WC338 TaxID=3425129 RepID=UPI003D81BD32
MKITPPASNKTTSRKVHYVLSSHWDREWYQSFQHFRYRLVQMLDRVLDGLADGRLKGPFTLDGQAIILEDYLEVRPERRQKIRDLVKHGQLIVGPWYVMPDEFLVSGESIIRNIQYGRQIARDYGGEPSNAGFLCDLFGHNSQMPQILAGFGIRAGLVWRGLNNKDCRLIRWQGADGTELPCYRFGKHGYCGYANEVRHAGEPLKENKSKVAADIAEASEALNTYLEQECRLTPQDVPLLAFDGGDHQYWDELAYSLLLEKQRDVEDQYKITHSSLDAYLNELINYADQIDEIVEGELREPGLHRSTEDNQWLIPGTGSSRVWIKQVNAACQTSLCQWAEPLSTMAHQILGREYPQAFLDLAWKWLIKNHPHDSICGCSIDQVHEDMKFRFNQSQQISERLTLEATQAITAHIEGGLADDEIRVTVFNPLATIFDQTADLTLQLPASCPIYPAYGGVAQELIYHVYDTDGNEIPTQTLSQTFNRTKVSISDSRFPQTYKTHDVNVSLPLIIPALGYTTLTVRPGNVNEPEQLMMPNTLATSECSMSNMYFDVTIESNGSITLYDKRTKQTYRRLLTFEDSVDCGDGWSRGTAVADQVYTSTASKSSIALVEDGPFKTSFRIRTTMCVPSAFNFSDEGQYRNNDLVNLDIDSKISLRPNTDYIEIQTTINNRASDHRLRVLFPSITDAQTYLSDSPFDVIERPIALRKDNHLYREPEIETKPQQQWTAVFDNDHGLAVISDGLLESAVRDQSDRPIALTLFRSTKHTVYTDGEPNGQLIGPMVFNYWITPLKGEPSRAKLSRMGQLLSAGLKQVNLPAQYLKQDISCAEISLPPSRGLLKLKGEAVLTSLRQVQDTTELRLFNPTTKLSLVELHSDMNMKIKHAKQINNESQIIGDILVHNDREINLELAPKQIISLSLDFDIYS